MISSMVTSVSRALLRGLLALLCFVAGCANASPTSDKDRSDPDGATLPDGASLSDGAFASDGASNKDGSAPSVDGCVPQTCAGRECGAYNDGCGGAISCGTCVVPAVCMDGECVCESTTCEAQGAQCGEISDGCGETLQCGNCSDAQVCGGGGANKCGDKPCEPKTCQQAGANCGQVSDGCGDTLSCGGCGTQQMCSSNKCVCKPRTCDQAGADCGQVSNGCGGTLSCGGCSTTRDCQSNQCVLPPHSGTTRKQIAYVVMAHPDDEMHGWAILERSTANFSVIIHGTQGEQTGYCKNASFPSYQPGLGEVRPGNLSVTAFNNIKSDGVISQPECKRLRVGSSRGFWGAVAGFDAAFSPAPFERHVLSGKSLPSGTPGRGCSVSRTGFEIWLGKNSVLVYFDLGDGNLSKCEVEWAISQVRRLRGTYYLPNLPEYSIVAPGLYHDKDPNNDWKQYDPVYPDCAHYGHPDHGAVHRAVFQTNFGTPGPQIGRTCSADGDVPNNSSRKNVPVDDYSRIFGVKADGTRTGAAQKYYGWLFGTSPYPRGDESQTRAPHHQSFWDVWR